MFNVRSLSFAAVCALTGLLIVMVMNVLNQQKKEEEPKILSIEDARQWIKQQ